MNKRAKACLIAYATVSVVGLTILLNQQKQIKTQISQIKESTTKSEKESKEQIKKLEEEMLKIEKNIQDEKKKYIKEIENKIASLQEPIIYNSNDVSQKAKITAPQLYRALETISPKESTFKELAWVISEASVEYNVNELFLAALIAQESGYGTSRRYIEDNNVGGYEVYTSKSKGRLFDTREDSVRAVAKLLGTEYLQENGRYYEGKSARSVNKRYCTESEGGQYEWSNNINKIAKELKDLIREDRNETIRELNKELKKEAQEEINQL